MLSSKETLCRAGIVKIEKLEEIELCTEFPRRSGIVKHTDFRFLVIQKNILLQKIRENDADLFPLYFAIFNFPRKR